MHLKLCNYTIKLKRLVATQYFGTLCMMQMKRSENLRKYVLGEQEAYGTLCMWLSNTKIPFVDGAANHYTLYDVKVMSCSVL